MVAATSSDTISCLLHGSPSQSTFLVPEKCGKGGDARAPQAGGDARSRLGQWQAGRGWSHTHRDWLAHTLEPAVVTHLAVEKAT